MSQGLKLSVALLAALAGTIAAGPAAAQIGGVFGDPPRPPADIPNGLPPQPPPAQMPGADPYRTPPGQAYPAYPPAIQSRPLPPPTDAGAMPPGGGSPQPQNPAQRARISPPQPGGAPQPANAPAAAPQPADTGPIEETVTTEMPAQKIPNGRAVFSGLDKITGRIISFDAAIGETVQFGALRVTARVCYTRPPTEPTSTDAFVEVDEVTLQGEIKRIFNGWMFAWSPGLHAVEHPIYDVWLTDCGSPPPTRVAEPAVQTVPAAAPTPPATPANGRTPGRTRQAAPRREPAQPAIPPQQQ